MRKPVDEDCPDRRVTLALDNPDAHGLGSICEIFRPEEADRTASRTAFSDSSLRVRQAGVIAIGAFACGASVAIWLLVRSVLGPRVPEEGEMDGIDSAELGLHAYPERATTRSSLPTAVRPTSGSVRSRGLGAVSPGLPRLAGLSARRNRVGTIGGCDGGGGGFRRHAPEFVAMQQGIVAVQQTPYMRCRPGWFGPERRSGDGASSRSSNSG